MIIRTIAGDIAPEKLGRTNYHEHAFQVSPLLPGDELTSKEKSGNEFLRLAKSGFDSYVDATPIGLGRRPDLIAEIANRSGLQVIHATGVHKEAHYANGQKITQLEVDQLAKLFAYELQTGILLDDSTLLINEANTSAIKAGFIKFGISDAPLSAFENRALQASAV
ncbi:MAG: aryldialkylphosphatase, partial [Actinobacteria bacterium]|nr:aryldialkylphosphatase [Actinomycetota bacterium]